MPTIPPSRFYVSVSASVDVDGDLNSIRAEYDPERERISLYIAHGPYLGLGITAAGHLYEQLGTALRAADQEATSN
jgi:hypothetical protein